MKYQHISLLCLLLAFLSSLSAQTVQELNQMTPEGIYGLLERQKIETFVVDNILKKGFSAHGLANWQTLTQNANQVVQDLIQRNKAPQEYDSYAERLAQCFNIIVESIEKARDNIKTGEVKNFTSIKANLILCKSAIAVIEKATFNAIVKNTKVPKSWTEKIPAFSLMVLSKAHKKVFDDYYEQAKVRNLTPEQVKTILAQNQIDITSDKQIGNLIENVQQYLYRLEHPKLKFIPYLFSKRKKYAKELIEQLRSLYPGIITKRDIALFGVSTDKASMILLAQAYTYYGVIEKLQKELARYL